MANILIFAYIFIPPHCFQMQQSLSPCVNIRGNVNFSSGTLPTSSGICFPRLHTHRPIVSLKLSFLLEKPGETKAQRMSKWPVGLQPIDLAFKRVLLCFVLSIYLCQALRQALTAQ